MIRRRLAHSHRWVVKIGSGILTHPTTGLNRPLIASLVGQLAALRNGGVELVLVSSGSIVEGMQRLGWQVRPHAIHRLQAAAAVGQMGLVQRYESAFKEHGLHTAQVLLTNADLSDRGRYLNSRSTLRTLLDLGVVPVVNENDTVVTEEIRLGDNDTLAALVSNLVEAELLVILTDQDGLFERNPAENPDAPLVPEAEAGDTTLLAMAGSGGALGRGGMFTKLSAAEKAARSGSATVIANGREPEVLLRLKQGETLGTLLTPRSGRLAARKQWLAGQLKVRGRLYLDAGAVRVLQESGRSLLPVGVTRAEGRFARGELVACLDPGGQEIARGLVNYDSQETARIIGRPSSEIERVLGYVDEPELVHRDNMVLR